MSLINYKPLIKNYNNNKTTTTLIMRNIPNNHRGVYVDFINHFGLMDWSESHMNLFKGVKIFAYGYYPAMNGKVCCYSHNLKNIHNYFKNLFVKGELFGNIVINRPTLPYQHFVLDFDLKRVDGCKCNEKVNFREYKEYIKSKRRNCSERFLMTMTNNNNNNNDNINDISNNSNNNNNNNKSNNNNNNDTNDNKVSAIKIPTMRIIATNEKLPFLSMQPIAFHH